MIKALGLGGKDIGHLRLREIILSSPETLGIAQICMGATSGNRVNFSSYELFNGLSVDYHSPIIYLKKDDKIIEFVGQMLPKPLSRGHLCSVSRRLNGIFGVQLTKRILAYVMNRIDP